MMHVVYNRYESYEFQCSIESEYTGGQFDRWRCLFMF
jgi:hypothetical protein